MSQCYDIDHESEAIRKSHKRLLRAYLKHDKLMADDTILPGSKDYFRLAKAQDELDAAVAEAKEFYGKA